MSNMTKLVSKMYTLTRKLNTAEKWISCDPKRIANRYKNKFIGKNFVSKTTKWPF